MADPVVRSGHYVERGSIQSREQLRFTGPFRAAQPRLAYDNVTERCGRGDRRTRMLIDA